MYYILYTLVFVVADKLGTGEPDLLWYTRGTQILAVPARPQPEQPDTDTNIILVLCVWFEYWISKESGKHEQVQQSADH